MVPWDGRTAATSSAFIAPNLWPPNSPDLNYPVDWLIEHGLTSPPTRYRLYGRRYLKVKSEKPNLQYQSTEWTVNPCGIRCRTVLSVERARRWRTEAAFDWRVGKSLEQIKRLSSFDHATENLEQLESADARWTDGVLLIVILLSLTH